MGGVTHGRVGAARCGLEPARGWAAEGLDAAGAAWGEPAWPVPVVAAPVGPPAGTATGTPSLGGVSGGPGTGAGIALAGCARLLGGSWFSAELPLRMT